MARMTRARTASYGVVTPPPLQLWLHAVLMRFVSLVQGARTTLGMIFKRNHRDWHTETAHDALPQAKSGNQFLESNTTHGVILGLVPRISVGTPRGLSIDPREAINQDARHKAERDSVDAAPSLSFRASRRRDPEPRGDKLRRRRVWPLGSGSRSRASGMTPLMCQQI